MCHEKAMLKYKKNEVILHCAIALFPKVNYHSDVENEIIRLT